MALDMTVSRKYQQTKLRFEHYHGMHIDQGRYAKASIKR